MVDAWCFVSPTRNDELTRQQVRDCVYITDHAYTRDEVLEMEQTILRRLKFELTVPTPWTFLVRFLKVAKATDRQHHRAQYYLERCLQEHDGLSYRPSMLAAASLFLARIPDSGLDDAWVRSEEKRRGGCLYCMDMNACIRGGGYVLRGCFFCAASTSTSVFCRGFFLRPVFFM